MAYKAAGRLSDAVPLLERTLADRDRILGPDLNGWPGPTGPHRSPGTAVAAQALRLLMPRVAQFRGPAEELSRGVDVAAPLQQHAEVGLSRSWCN